MRYEAQNMDIKRYNFETFLEQVKGEDCAEIKRLAAIELGSVEQDVKNTKPPTERKYHIGNLYAKQITEFLFYMHNGTKPATVEEEDFELYKIVVSQLVGKRIYKQSALDIFNAA